MDEYIVIRSDKFAKLCNKNVTETSNAGVEKTASTAQSNDQLEKTDKIKGLPKYSLPLYEFLKTKSPSIDWNSNNELLVSGSLVPDSNILLLFKDATNPQNEKIQSNLASWRVFKNWLLENNVPTTLLNNNVKIREKSPEIQNPVVESDFPSLNELKNSEVPLTINSVEKPATKEDSAINNSAKEENKKIRKSDRVIKPPKRYGRGLAKKTKKVKKIKWIRF